MWGYFFSEWQRFIAYCQLRYQVHWRQKRVLLVLNCGLFKSLIWKNSYTILSKTHNLNVHVSYIHIFMVHETRILNSWNEKSEHTSNRPRLCSIRNLLPQRYCHALERIAGGTPFRHRSFTWQAKRITFEGTSIYADQRLISLYLWQIFLSSWKYSEISENSETLRKRLKNKR